MTDGVVKIHGREYKTVEFSQMQDHASQKIGDMYEGYV